MKAPFVWLILFLFPGMNTGHRLDFDQFCANFVKEYQSLHIPDLQMSYVGDLQNIGSIKSVNKQVAFFTETESGIRYYQLKKLTKQQQQDYLQIEYEADLNLKRLALEKQWLAHKSAKISVNGISTVPDGKQWYVYLLNKWLSTTNVTPDEIYRFGLTEVADVKAHITKIQEQSGLNEQDFYHHLNAPEFFTSDTTAIRHLFEQRRDTIYAHLDKIFHKHAFPELKIRRGAAAAPVQTPGYYDNNTFYYNLFDKPYNKRQVDWLFLHEGVPGHHYQTSIYNEQKHSPVQQLFFYLCYAEGWAAYTEELGKELGVYKTPYDELGKWEWDIVRAVRIPMDVGLNYYGWTDKQALAFWRKNIPNQDDIALREIARVKRWPVQAITYNYGAVQIKTWKKELQKKYGSKFDIKDFHDRVLNSGPLPLFLVKRNVMD